MDAMQALLTRRSVRRFTDQPVNPADLESVLRAAMHAPSAMNQQPWQFVVVADRQTREQLVEIHPHAKSLLEAPLGILVCGDLRLQKSEDFWVQDCAAATQNLMLAAHALGLGSVWQGVYPRMARLQAIQELLCMPEEVLPFALLSLGHPASLPPEVDRFLPERIHSNQW